MWHLTACKISPVMFRPMGMVGEACLPSNAYYPRTPDFTLYSGVHSVGLNILILSFVYGFMSLNYGLGTMTTTTIVSLFWTGSKMKWCFYRISKLMLSTLIQRYDKWSFLFKNERLPEILQAVRCHIYDRIYTIYQFIKPFLDKNVYFWGAFKVVLFLSEYEFPLKGRIFSF